MSSEQSSGTSSKTRGTLMLANLEILTQQLREYAGLILDGPASLSEIKISPKGHSTDITLTASCVRSSDTVLTMVVSLKLSPLNPNSPSPSSQLSNQSISSLTPLTSSGKDGSQIKSDEMVSSLVLQAASDIFGADEAKTRRFEKLLHTILNAHWPK